MVSPRDATWRFINVAPIMAGQAALDALFAETLQAFGIDRFGCIFLPDGDYTKYPRIISDRGMMAWTRYFFEQGYNEIDPCPLVCGRFTGAYTWSDVKVLSAIDRASAMWADARAGGMREGLIVPMVPRRLTGSIVRLVTPEDQFEPGMLPLLQSISVIYASSVQYFHVDAAKGIVIHESSNLLTDREIECLHWTARGKTNTEIAIILKISRHTVNTHIEKAKSKLGVGTRVQAAAIAHQLGLLSIA